MKVGIRVPSPTKSIKARTTGRIERTVKSSYDPTYGKKGIGYLKDPERAIKNKVYHKMTVDPLDSLKHCNYDPEITDAPKKPRPVLSSIFSIIGIICIIYTVYSEATYHVFSGAAFFLALVCIIMAFILLKKK